MLPDLWVMIAGVFVLGTYVVATMDDVIHMAASKSFIYIWIAIAFVLASFEFFTSTKMLVVRLLIAIAIYMLFCTGLLKFKIEYADFFAMLPLLFLLPTWYLIGFLALVALLDRLLFSLYYTKFRKKTTYPFMPAILTASVIIIILFYILSFTTLVQVSWKTGNLSAENAENNSSWSMFSFWKEKGTENSTQAAIDIENPSTVSEQKKEAIQGKDIADNPLS